MNERGADSAPKRRKMHAWCGELQPDALRPVKHVFASKPGTPYRQKKGLLSHRHD
jgi:hypothetical protein